MLQITLSEKAQMRREASYEDQDGGDEEESGKPSQSILPASKKTKRSPGEVAAVLTEFLNQSRREQAEVTTQVIMYFSCLASLFP